MTKVTYLFGAGASANALPVVEKLPERINSLVEDVEANNLWLLPEDEIFRRVSKKPKREFQQKLLADFRWLSGKADPTLHASIDTFAKKLFLRGENEMESLNRLKTALSMFFILEQARCPVDLRYDTFFASILEKDGKGFKLPENLRIISWNYDYQFEKAFCGFTQNHSLGENQERLNIVSKIFPSNKLPSGFSIIKLNGTTTFLKRGISYYEPLDDMSIPFGAGLLNMVIAAYAKIVENRDIYYPMLSFAWEKWEPVENEKTIIDKAIACAEDTEVLVVIGYSFPFFNREVDRKIIGAMTKLRRVYFQAPAPWHEKIRTRFQAIRQDIDPKNLVAYDEVESFLLPDELEL